MPNGSSKLSGVMIPTTYSSRPFRCHATGQWPGPLDVHFECVCPMSALPPKADIAEGHCQLCAKSGHMRRSLPFNEQDLVGIPVFRSVLQPILTAVQRP